MKIKAARVIPEKHLPEMPAAFSLSGLLQEQDMKVVKTLCGKEVILDDAVTLPRQPFIVAGRYPAISTGGRSNYMMVHHFVWGEKTRLDHINGNPLDNRRENLRAVGQSVNSHNRAAFNMSGLRGVYPVSGVKTTRGKPYRASIYKDGINYHLGVFATATEAAQAYDVKARTLYGPNARTNFNV